MAQVTDLESGRDCEVEFSDGSATIARISRSENDWQLHTGAYRTAAGTEIADKHWRVDLIETDGRVEFRVFGRVQK